MKIAPFDVSIYSDGSLRRQGTERARVAALCRGSEERGHEGYWLPAVRRSEENDAVRANYIIHSA